MCGSNDACIKNSILDIISGGKYILKNIHTYGRHRKLIPIFLSIVDGESCQEKEKETHEKKETTYLRSFYMAMYLTRKMNSIFIGKID